MKHFFISIILLCTVITTGSTQTLHIYGGSSHDEYLGCLNCSELDPDSIWNELGIYGNSLRADSIWNSLGTYGNDLSSYSPWNDFASYPPVVVDPDGNFYGYLTVNDLKSKRADFSLAIILYKYHDQIKDDVDGWYRKIFE